MSSGKKGKKKKNCKTVDLMSFLADGGGTPTIPLKSSSWADEVDDEHEGYLSRTSKEPVVLPTAPRAARGSRVDDENIPTNPPFVAYISSLPYEIDTEDLADFFGNLKVTNVRLPKDPNKQLRGYGYVEFEDRESLIEALSMSHMTLKTRRVRIEVSNSSNEDSRGGRMSKDDRRPARFDPERTSGDWRSGPRTELPRVERRWGIKDGEKERDRDRERERDGSYDDKPGAWRNRDDGDRGRSTFRDDGERGRSTFRDRGYRDDDKEKEWRHSDRGSRDRDGDRGSSYGPSRDYKESAEWERGKSLDPKSDPPRTRQKLQLQPRTKPLEPSNVKEEKEPIAQSSSSVSAANIFGAAKPVDTAAREREIEERLAKSYAESRFKEEAESEKRKEWVKRNGESREEREKDKDRDRGRETWRSEDDSRKGGERSTSQSHSSRSVDRHEDAKGAQFRSGGPPSKASHKEKPENRGSDRERKDRDREKDGIDRMPKAKDEEAPNFVVSNKYSMLPDDVDPDNIED